MEEKITVNDIRRRGFYDLCNLLNKHKEKITYSDVIKEVIAEGWYSDFRRIGMNTVIRQIERHNKKYENK